jgi:hypothetical protein
VTIRIYNSFGMSLGQLGAAQQTAAAIFHDAGIDSIWRNCRTPKGPSKKATDKCDDVLGTAEVIVRIVTAPTPDTGDQPSFGYSHVDLGTGRGSLSTVFGDRIYASVRRFGIQPAPLLGRVLAHEVAHLLMGTQTHSETGLMRAHWSHHSLQRNRKQDWLLSHSETMQMVQALSARTSWSKRPVIPVWSTTGRSELATAGPATCSTSATEAARTAVSSAPARAAASRAGCSSGAGR